MPLFVLILYIDWLSCANFKMGNVCVYMYVFLSCEIIPETKMRVVTEVMGAL